MTIETVYYTITESQREAIEALNHCVFLPMSPQKRFIRQMQSENRITNKQREWLFKIFFAHRVQMGLSERRARMIVVAMKAEAELLQPIKETLP